MRIPHLAAMALAAVIAAPSSQAATIAWTDWTSAGPSSASGTLTVGSASVAVGFSGAYSFVQTGGGTDYWVPSAPYLSSTVSNRPTGTDIVALDAGGTKTITFSQAIVDPIIALVSWNGNVADFGTPIEVLSEGAGFWGSGTAIVNGSGTGFTGSGELHGAIRLSGTFTSITFTDTSENWHGFTIGVTNVAVPPAVPAPPALAVLGMALVGLFGLRRLSA